jgi:hypothetical protein
MEAEMKTPPPRSGNWEGLGPQRPEPYAPHKEREKQQSQMKEVNEGNGVPLRKETQSGIPGLTYDQAGRPVYVHSLGFMK